MTDTCFSDIDMLNNQLNIKYSTVVKITNSDDLPVGMILNLQVSVVVVPATEAVTVMSCPASPFHR